MDEMEEADCAKIVKKDQCEKKGDKCKKSCDMCDGEPASTQATGMRRKLPVSYAGVV